MLLNSTCISQLRQQLNAGIPLAECLQSIASDVPIVHELWRFCTSNWPEGGPIGWNSAQGWRRNWGTHLPARAVSIGEDVFGNQLLVLGESPEVWWWNHEDASACSLMVDLPTLWEVVLADGLSWMDQYNESMLDLGRRCAVPLTHHLHWRTPLFLGGEVAAPNLVPVERVSHLNGHASLFKQINGLPPGSEIVSQ